MSVPQCIFPAYCKRNALGQSRSCRTYPKGRNSERELRVPVDMPFTKSRHFRNGRWRHLDVSVGTAIRCIVPDRIYDARHTVCRESSQCNGHTPTAGACVCCEQEQRGKQCVYHLIETISRTAAEKLKWIPCYRRQILNRHGTTRSNGHTYMTCCCETTSTSKLNM